MLSVRQIARFSASCRAFFSSTTSARRAAASFCNESIASHWASASQSWQRNGASDVEIRSKRAFVIHAQRRCSHAWHFLSQKRASSPSLTSVASMIVSKQIAHISVPSFPFGNSVSVLGAIIGLCMLLTLVFMAPPRGWLSCIPISAHPNHSSLFSLLSARADTRDGGSAGGYIYRTSGLLLEICYAVDTRAHAHRYYRNW